MSRPPSTRRVTQGVVTSDRGTKTITVEVVHMVRYKKLGKTVREDRRIHAHDEKGEARVGDTVELVECRPMSRTKQFRLVRVVQRSAGEPVITGAESAADQAQSR
jgi:small subunit ribosomal protein S17